ncbi:MAG: GNAT family N-acetyltransferase [Armatimonadota bacterium]
MSDVLVRTGYQGQGIGSELVRRLLVQIQEIDPYFIQVTPIDDCSQHLYEKFGFTDMSYFRRLELRTGKLAKKVAQVRGEEG